MANMLKGFWPTGPQDQTTPKATSAGGGAAPERNPFDAHAASYTAQLQRQHSANGGATGGANSGKAAAGAGELARLGGDEALGPSQQANSISFDFNREAQQEQGNSTRGASFSQRMQMQSGELTPSGLRTPGGFTSQSSIPTTSLSTTGELHLLQNMAIA
jgi:hypothetical protein